MWYAGHEDLFDLDATRLHYAAKVSLMLNKYNPI